MTPMEALRYISSPTMGLPAGREAEDFVRSKDVDPENARYALEICIRMAKQAVAQMEAQLEGAKGKSASELISEYADALTFPDDLPGGAELRALELTAVYQDGTAKVIARQEEGFEDLEEGQEISVNFDLVVKPPVDPEEEWFRKIAKTAGPQIGGGGIVPGGGMIQSGPWGVAPASLPTHFEQYRATFDSLSEIPKAGQQVTLNITSDVSHAEDALIYSQEALKRLTMDAMAAKGKQRRSTK